MHLSGDLEAMNLNIVLSIGIFSRPETIMEGYICQEISALGGDKYVCYPVCHILDNVEI